MLAETVGYVEDPRNILGSPRNQTPPLARSSLGEGGRPPWLAVALVKAAACHADLSRQSPSVGGSLGEGGTPEPKRIAIGLITRKGKLSPATEKFCQCAKDAFSGGR